MRVNFENAFACTRGAVIRVSRTLNIVKAGHRQAKRSIGRLFKLITSKLFARSSFIAGSGKSLILGRNVPSRAFGDIHPNSVGCISVSNSKSVAGGSRITVKKAIGPRVICNFKTATHCGRISFGIFFRKGNGARHFVNNITSGFLPKSSRNTVNGILAGCGSH